MGATVRVLMVGIARKKDSRSLWEVKNTSEMVLDWMLRA